MKICRGKVSTSSWVCESGWSRVFGQKRRNLDFQPGRWGGRGLLCSGGILRRNYRACFALLSPTKICHLPCTSNFTAVLSKTSGPSRRAANFVRGLKKRIQKIPPGSETGRWARGKEDAEQGWEWALVQDQSQVYQSRAHGSCIGSVAWHTCWGCLGCLVCNWWALTLKCPLQTKWWKLQTGFDKFMPIF